MLITFEFENSFSFKDNQEFSMVCSPLKEQFNSFENIFSITDDIKLVKTAVIYGANASGKSNFLKSMHFVKTFLRKSYLNSDDNGLNPFILDMSIYQKASSFEFTFFHNNRIFRYGFEISRTDVIEEWLYVKIEREKKIFHRNENEIVINGNYPILSDLRDKKMIGKGALLLTLAAQFNDRTSKEVFEWFNKFNVISGISDSNYHLFTSGYINNSSEKDKVLNLLKVADFGIEDLVIEVEEKNEELLLPVPNSNVTSITKKEYKVYSKRNVLSTNGLETLKIDFHFESFESEGTKKFYNLLGPIINSIETGGVLVIDELETKLHPLLTQRLIKLFNNKEFNKYNAQLIFATHNTHLLGVNLFRRDQIWFTEKDNDGATHLYPLTDFSTRNDEKLEKNYIAGKYGAIPFLGDFDSLFDKGIENEKG